MIFFCLFLLFLVLITLKRKRRKLIIRKKILTNFFNLEKKFGVKLLRSKTESRHSCRQKLTCGSKVETASKVDRTGLGL